MLNNIGLPGLLLIAVVVLVLFGRGKISSLMGEVGKGITAFKKGVDDSKKEIEDEASDVARDVTPEEEKEYRRRQKSRNLVLGGILLFMAVLFYAITIVRM